MGIVALSASLDDPRQYIRTRIRHTLELELQGYGLGWTDVTRDVRGSVSFDYGISSNGVADRVADAGTLRFALDNSEHNSLGTLGSYARMHLRRRAGFELGIRVRYSLWHLGRRYIKHVGTLDDATPSAGRFGDRITDCVSVDWMDDAARARYPGIAIQLSKRADQLITTLLAAMTTSPTATSFDTGVETFPYALDSAQDESSYVREEIVRICQSEPGYFYLRGDGTARFENRQRRLLSHDNVFVFDGLASNVVAPYRRSIAPNRVSITTHGRTVDADYSVLFALADQPLIAPGASNAYTVQGPYTDPSTAGARVGAVDVQNPLLAGVDYSANTVTSGGAGAATTPFLLRPSAAGTYTGFSGAVADVADNNPATFMTPTGGLIYQTYVSAGIVGALSTAAVAAVRVIATVKHNDTSSHFTNWYLRVRLNGVNLDVFGNTIYDSSSAVEISVTLPEPPGGGAWTVAAINALEFGGAFNWDAATPYLTDIRVEGLYDSTVVTTDRTSDFSVVVTAGANSATFVVTNNGATAAYLTKLQIRGRLVTTYDPVTVESINTAHRARVGENPARMDMPYQTDSAFGALVAAYFAYLYPATSVYNIDAIDVRPNLDERLMQRCLALDIGDRIGVRESATGASPGVPGGGPASASIGYFINRVSGTVSPGGILELHYGLAPADPAPYWFVGVPGFSELGVTTWVGPL